jgi:hypothetical protein
MQDYYSKDTPIKTGAKVFLVLYINITSKNKINIYQYMVGSLNYLATYTKADIAFAIRVLSRFLSNPSLQYIKAARRIFEYLQGIIMYAVVLGGKDIEEI